MKYASNYNTLLSVTLVCWRRTGLWWLKLAVFAMLLLSGSAYADLPKEFRQPLSKFKISEASVSALVIELESQHTLLSHRADFAQNPASVMKLITTYAALDILGPAHTWQTRYYINGSLNKGVLQGDLVIKGGGDPYLVQEQFWLQLAALRAQGIKTISGNLLIDNSAFDLPEYDRNEFDQQATRLYNVGPSATMLNFNASRFRIQPGDGKIEVIAIPALHNIIINNQLKPAAGKCRGARNGWSVDVVQKDGKAFVAFRGAYTTQCGNFDLLRAVLDSDAYLFGMFTQLWRRLGGQFEGGYVHAEVKQDAEAIYTGTSKPLSEVIAGTNKHSNNLLARQLLLAIAYANFGEGSTIKDGVDSIQAWLDDNNLSMPELVMENGSGLSRQIQVSADSLGALLLHASNSLYQPEYLASFALGGMDGTMKKRLKKLKLGGRARLKTGYVKGVRSLAGYVRADSGKDYLLVLLLVDKKVNFSNGNVLQDAFIKWVLAKG